MTRLHKLASTCEYQDANDVIIGQIIEKCSSHELRKKLLQEKTLTLDKVQEVARALEAANIQCKSIGGKSVTASETQVNKVALGNKHDSQKEKFQTQRKHKHSKPSQDLQGQQSAHHNYTRKPTQGECFRCGMQGHKAYDKQRCPATGKTCSKCGYLGHFAKHCRGFKPKQIHSTSELEGNAQSSQTSNHNKVSSIRDSTETDFAFQINSVSHKLQRVYVTIHVYNTPILMQLDTVADVTVMSEEVANNIPNLLIQPYDKELKDYSEHVIDVLGTAEVHVQYGQQNIGVLPLTIVYGRRPTLLGLNWIRLIDFDWDNLLKVEMQDKENDMSLQGVLSEFSNVFEGSKGTVKGIKAKLNLKPEATPKFFAPRPIPFALKALVEQEIRLEAENIWERVAYSDWGTPLVAIAKRDGGIRLCGDYKVTVNTQIQVAQHPLPNPTDMFAALGGCKVFSKLDLKHAYQQLIMDEKSQEICTINTHLGLFRPQRLPFGVASSPAIWQQTMDKLFTGLPGVFCFIDDILVAGKDEREHRQRLRSVLQRMQENGIQVHKDKCKFQVSSVEYLGFIINEQGIHKTRDKVQAVQDAKVPESVKDLKSFWDL